MEIRNSNGEMIKATRKEFRDSIRAKYQDKCAYCGIDLNDSFHCDHVLPIHRRKNGTCRYPERDHYDNIVGSCAQCNLAKKQLSIEGFRTRLRRKLIQLNKLANFRLAKVYGQVQETPTKIVFWFEKVKEQVSLR